MKRELFSIPFFMALPFLSSAETLNVSQGGVTYKFDSEICGVMPFAEGKSLTISGKRFTLDEGTQIFVDNSAIPDKIMVAFLEEKADVIVPGAIASLVSVSVEEAMISIVAETSVDLEVSGTASNGQFALKTSEPLTVTLSDLDLKNPSDAAISITGSGKVRLEIDGQNSLASGVSSSKPTLRFKTPAEIAGDGTLKVSATAPAEKAIKSNDELTISGANIIASVSGSALYDATVGKVKSAACLASDTNMFITGGNLTLSASGSGAKGISVDGNLTISGGNIDLTTTGGMAVYSGGSFNQNYTGNADRINSDLKSSPKGIKVDGTVEIAGGSLRVSTSGNGGEGIESKTTLTISDGTIYVKAYDDGINSSSHMYISGGDIISIAKANDGLDSNGNMYISGGTIRAFGASSPECGLDANEEEGYSVVFTGGVILGVGGKNSVPSTTASTQPYLTSNISLSAGQTLTVKQGETTLATFEIPADYVPSSGGFRPVPPAGMPPMRFGPGGWGGGNKPGGQSGGGVLVSLPSMTKSTTYTLTNGTTTTTSTSR